MRSEATSKIQQKLSENIIDSMTQTDRLKPNVFRVSEVVYCKRKPMLKRMFKHYGTPNGKMLSGTLFHELIPKLAKGVEDLQNAEYERELSGKFESKVGPWELCGHCDGISEDWIYEFKFTGRSYHKEIPEQYLMQANLYSHLAGRNQENNYRGIRIILVNSTTLDVQAYEEPYDEELVTRTLADLNEIHENMAKGILPDGPRYSWECLYCDLAKECFEARGKLKEFEKLINTKEAIKWKSIHKRKREGKERELVMKEMKTLNTQP